MYIFCITDLLLSNRRCADLLFIVLNPNTTKWAYTDTDSSTLTCTMTRRTIGGGGGICCTRRQVLKLLVDNTLKMLRFIIGTKRLVQEGCNFAVAPFFIIYECFSDLKTDLFKLVSLPDWVRHSQRALLSGALLQLVNVRGWTECLQSFRPTAFEFISCGQNILVFMYD